ncbi:hypothetical protein AA23498_2157 [Acetobacter nitrogenifigens DSM 23921 = NBRC 105050]|uniref:HNH nuclease domain-containing protein n=1 Tax=Acetobacter nitrogenifigens DSM 23921 = NBRC 105050 TaxID=1120919 RepID=A0A511X6V7_9PROT|nr:hypothetical protein AA23498_2157 [Acetobacter nitrogenifigens DSM 23921 = NBRC 105050]GEN58661.1 hypothetical protein ANI02nite_05450 [Acetobacter nitrogenifigens DSM 23921 = NBRC 105050]
MLEKPCRLVIGGHAKQSGHVAISGGGVTEYAHRVALEQEIGPIPDGKMVMHLCNNPACTEPSHLKCGTHAENMLYMKLCGRSGSKRIPVSVRSVVLKRLQEGNLNHKQIAAEVGVSWGCVRKLNATLKRYAIGNRNQTSLFDCV